MNHIVTIVAKVESTDYSTCVTKIILSYRSNVPVCQYQGQMARSVAYAIHVEMMSNFPP